MIRYIPTYTLISGYCLTLKVTGIYRIENRGTFVVVKGRVDVVGSDSVDTKGLHKSGITQAERAVAQWVRAHPERL